MSDKNNEEERQSTYQFIMRKIDIYGEPLQWYIGTNETYQTVAGGFRTFLVISIALIYLLYLIIMLFKDRNGSFVMYDISYSELEDAEFKYYEHFEIFFFFKSSSSMMEMDTSIFQAYLTQVDASSNSFTSQYPFEECDNEYFSEQLGFSANVRGGLEKTYCINPEQYTNLSFSLAQVSPLGETTNSVKFVLMQTCDGSSCSDDENSKFEEAINQIQDVKVFIKSFTPNPLKMKNVLQSQVNSFTLTNKYKGATIYFKNYNITTQSSLIPYIVGANKTHFLAYDYSEDISDSDSDSNSNSRRRNLDGPGSDGNSGTGGTGGTGDSGSGTGGDTSGTGDSGSGTGGDTSGTGDSGSGTGGDTTGTGDSGSGTGGDTSGSGGGTGDTNTGSDGNSDGNGDTGSNENNNNNGGGGSSPAGFGNSNSNTYYLEFVLSSKVSFLERQYEQLDSTLASFLGVFNALEIIGRVLTFVFDCFSKEFFIFNFILKDRMFRNNNKRKFVGNPPKIISKSKNDMTNNSGSKDKDLLTLKDDNHKKREYSPSSTKNNFFTEQNLIDKKLKNTTDKESNDIILSETYKDNNRKEEEINIGIFKSFWCNVLMIFDKNKSKYPDVENALEKIKLIQTMFDSSIYINLILDMIRLKKVIFNQQQLKLFESIHFTSEEIKNYLNKLLSCKDVPPDKFINQEIQRNQGKKNNKLTENMISILKEQNNI